MHNKPQEEKIIAAEVTQTILDAKFDRDLRCAMNEA